MGRVWCASTWVSTSSSASNLLWFLFSTHLGVGQSGPWLLLENGTSFQLCGSKGPSFEEWCSPPRPWHNESSPLFPLFFSSFLPISMVMQILGWHSFFKRLNGGRESQCAAAMPLGGSWGQ